MALPLRPGAFAALRHRNFRLLWTGQLFSMAGSLMQVAAVLWHVSLLAPADKKGLALGLVGLVRILPIIGFSLLSGVVADALDRRRLMLVTQSIAAAVAMALAAITFGGIARLWPIYLLAALSSAAAAFDGPARQSLIPMLVPRRSLANAISLNTIMFQAAAVLGPSLAGVVIATGGVGWAYACNSVSYLGVIVALLRMRDLPARAAGAPKGEVSWKAAGEGLRFVFGTPIIRSTMLLDFFATFFSSATALLPLYAQDILQVGAAGYGVLYAAPSIGALATGGLMVALTERIERRGRALVWAVVFYGLATVLFGLSSSFWLTFLALALIGSADMVSTVLRNLIRQLLTPDHLRGRMTSVNMMFFMGGPQLGELEAGVVANLFGASASVVSGGIACLAATGLIVARTPEIVRYRREPAERDAAD